ncbi:hypothetical protein B0H11DRAFT_1970923 [Mycena galericulata]|nr:hypothetical protein B0H11DRAFT_1970923 [Mycena galericulata]
MSGDAEQGIPAVEADKHNDSEASCAKIWSVYISEAEKYDKALVESWRGDMDGMLIFAGLFSASLTAFIIESYKTLTPDSGDTTAVLLARISKQLAASASGETFQIPAPAVFVVPVTSVVCNILWFISLGLSLACALIATLVEQWARDFVQKAEMRPSPVIRARIFSYLYYGLKRFNMHVVVDLVPLLLHMSLILFFAGLVAFLLPINRTVMAVAAALLGILAAVYCTLTILPLVYFDCPYRTPFSTVLWRIRQLGLATSSRLAEMRQGWRQEPPRNIRDYTMVEVMISRATQPSAERDQRALCWTMKSLTDDAELQPFIEGIPDVLWGPNGRKYKHDHLIRGLLQDPEVRLGDRILDLMRHSDSGLLPPDVEFRHKVSCVKALWSICILAERGTPLNFPMHALSRQIAEWISSGDPSDELRGYLVAAQAVLNWCILCSFDSLIQGFKEGLEKCLSDKAAGRVFTFGVLRIGLDRMLEDSRAFSISHVWNHYLHSENDSLIDEGFVEQLAESIPTPLCEATPWFEKLRAFLHDSQNFWDDARHTILHTLLLQSLLGPDEGSTIHELGPTLQMLRNQLTLPSASRMKTYLDLVEMTKKNPWRRYNADVFAVIMPFLFPMVTVSRPPIDLDTINTMISFFAAHPSFGFHPTFPEKLDETISLAHLWGAITQYLTAGCPRSNNAETTLEVICHLYYHSGMRFVTDGEIWSNDTYPHSLWFNESILSALHALPVCSPLPSVLALVKSHMLLALMYDIWSRLAGPEGSRALAAKALVQRIIAPIGLATPSDWKAYTYSLSHPLFSETRLSSAATGPCADFDFDFDFEACDDDAEKKTQFIKLHSEVTQRFIDAWAALTAEFIEACCSPILPYWATQTLVEIADHNVFRAHAIFRNRFASSVHALMKARTLSSAHTKIWEYFVLDSHILEQNCATARSFMICADDVKYDTSAILTIKNALEEYADSIRGSATPLLETRVEKLVNDLEALLPPTGATSNASEALRDAC